MEIDMGRRRCHLIRVQCTILRVFLCNVVIIVHHCSIHIEYSIRPYIASPTHLRLIPGL